MATAKPNVECWAEGKAPLVAMIAATMARAAEDIYDWLLHQERSRGVSVPVGDVDGWLKLYRQHRRVMRA